VLWPWQHPLRLSIRFFSASFDQNEDLMTLGKRGGWHGAVAVAVPLLLLLVPATASWHECNSQGVFPGLYGSAALAK
jgi:hypothetical protein